MKSNPGGQLDSRDVIGRDALCEQIQETLEQQSIIMTAERRIGKTHVMKLIQERKPDNWTAIYSDLEKIHSVDEFVQLIQKETQQYLSLTEKGKNLLKSAYKFASKSKIDGYQLPELAEKSWQQILEESIDLLSKEQCESGCQVLFLWDEVPYMLSNILQNNGADIVKQLLDTLRTLRKDYENFRILITGSIGLHHIINELKKGGYPNEPFNDVYNIEVEPLKDEYARSLASHLIRGENMDADNLSRVTMAISEQSDNFPFYIHHIVKALKFKFSLATEENVLELVQAVLFDDNDPWELKHYATRLRDYYGSDEALIKLILDSIALDDAVGLSAKELLVVLKNQTQFDDIERLRELLSQLAQDHYLSKSTNNKYHFKFSLIQRWWKIYRELDD